MQISKLILDLICVVSCALISHPVAQALEKRSGTPLQRAVSALDSKSESQFRQGTTSGQLNPPISSVVIIPFRSADIPTEVKGVISKFHYEKGDLIEKGKPVVEISKDRYSILMQVAKSKLEGLKQNLQLAEQNLQFKKDVYSKNYGTRQKLLEAQSEVAVTRQRVEEAKRELELAKLNLDCCVIKAPFTGYIVEKYKEAYEAVNQLDKLFRIVDTRKVYAVANVPELNLSGFTKGIPSFFVDSAGGRYRGTVDKIEPILCPESKTAKVLVLLENPQFNLKVGMTGALRSE
jgi:RND family efflux transporter MFP subunit